MAKTLWERQYKLAATSCFHVQIDRECENGDDCDQGRRNRSVHIFTGRILRYFNEISKAMLHGNGTAELTAPQRKEAKDLISDDPLPEEDPAEVERLSNLFMDNLRQCLPSELITYYRTQLITNHYTPDKDLERFKVKYVDDFLTSYENLLCAGTFIDHVTLTLPQDPIDSLNPEVPSEMAATKRTSAWLCKNLELAQHVSAIHWGVGNISTLEEHECDERVAAMKEKGVNFHVLMRKFPEVQLIMNNKFRNLIEFKRRIFVEDHQQKLYSHLDDEHKSRSKVKLKIVHATLETVGQETITEFYYYF